MPSQEVDNLCYWQAIDECIGGAPEAVDLHQFRHVTDSGILAEWMGTVHQRAVRHEEEQEVRTRFLELTREAHARDPSAFMPSKGLIEWLEHLLKLDNHHIAIATGGWGHTARFKLEAAGLDRFELPLASSDDHGDRTQIMRVASKHLLGRQEPGSMNPDAIRTCYVGDGPWDYHASMALGWEFVGIAAGPRAARLREAGAQQIFSNFSEFLRSNPYASSAQESSGHAIA